MSVRVQYVGSKGTVMLRAGEDLQIGEPLVADPDTGKVRAASSAYDPDLLGYALDEPDDEGRVKVRLSGTILGSVLEDPRRRMEIIDGFGPP